MTESELLNSAARKKALLAGEAIVDRYVYVRPLGRPSKDAIISVEKVSEQTWIGGVDAAAVHARAITPNLTVRTAGRTYEKTRYVESTHLRKMFEFYSPVEDHRPALINDLHMFDAVVLLDYGHGMFTNGHVAPWSAARYLAVNVQTNSGNYGYNLATKYEAVDYLCVDESEARLATQNRDDSIVKSIEQLAKRATKLVITLGRNGAVGWSQEEGIVYCGAFTDKVVDTIGAGDAFFACTALVAEEADMLSLLRIGNAAGALKSGIIGHTKGVTKDELIALLASIPRDAESGAGKYPG